MRPLVWARERGLKRVLIECKLSRAPKPSRGFHQLISDLKPDQAWLAAPVDESFELRAGIKVADIGRILLPD